MQLFSFLLVRDSFTCASVKVLQYEVLVDCFENCDELLLTLVHSRCNFLSDHEVGFGVRARIEHLAKVEMQLTRSFGARVDYTSGCP
jgi:hypothetical protein